MGVHGKTNLKLQHGSVANALNKPVPIIGFCIMCKPRLKYSLGSLARLSTFS